ncbi:hypothetical protein DB30_02980 [Enhygromyxa salina]|uniref:Lipoprotein n=1 Tax=Enhygromyxa salina TaxID=215803 RepID=A0A0C2D7Y2_9BACT|nr:hypothetical protein [Enhygromyxa salina]KIG17705.1 hypothetical protein DB30_02980 [Enhygromyxa salina]
MNTKTIKTISTFALTSVFALGTIACDKKDDAKKDDAKKTDATKDDAKKTEDVKAEEPAPEEAQPEEAQPEEAAAAPTGPQPSNDKEFLGLDLQPIDDTWQPEWDADAKVAKWSNDDFFFGIVIRVVDDKLTNMDELEAAAPMMMQVGTAISSVTKDVQTTEQGWWTVVKYDDDKGEVYLNIADVNGVTVVCSANLGSSMGDAIPEELAHRACSSYKVKE